MAQTQKWCVFLCFLNICSLPPSINHPTEINYAGSLFPGRRGEGLQGLVLRCPGLSPLPMQQPWSLQTVSSWLPSVLVLTTKTPASPLSTSFTKGRDPCGSWEKKPYSLSILFPLKGRWTSIGDHCEVSIAAKPISEAGWHSGTRRAPFHPGGKLGSQRMDETE